MAKKQKKAATELNIEILVGFVNSFNFNDKQAEQALDGHPRPGRLYQVIKDDQYGYRIHIGADNTPSNMAGILLGESLVGEHDDKWSFDVAIVTKENFLNFSIHEEDTIKLGEWFETDNKELRETLGQPVKVVASDKEGNFIEFPDQSLPAEISAMMAKFESSREDKYHKFTNDLSGIESKDPELFNIIVDVVSYLATTYGDKYEASGKVNMGKEFLLSSASSDTAIFNSLKYLQRYCTVGFEKSQNKKDLMKAIHYTLFELQRRQRNEQK